MLRSELTITPSASAHSAPGSSDVGVARWSRSRAKASCVITSSAASSPAITVCRLATEATGLVQMIQHALISPGGHALEHLDGAAADLGADACPAGMPHRSSTKARSSSDEHRTLAGQARAHVAHLAAAHGVRLPGQRERAAAGPADRAGGQVQVAEGVGVPGAVRALVEAHRPAAHPVRRPRRSIAPPCGCRPRGCR